MLFDFEWNALDLKKKKKDICITQLFKGKLLLMLNTLSSGCFHF